MNRYYIVLGKPKVYLDDDDNIVIVTDAYVEGKNDKDDPEEIHLNLGDDIDAIKKYFEEIIKVATVLKKMR